MQEIAPVKMEVSKISQQDNSPDEHQYNARRNSISSHYNSVEGLSLIGSSFISACAARLSGEQILKNMEQIEKAETIIEQNVNKSLTLETMAFKLNY